MPAAVYEFSDGEQLAVLECEGDYPRSASSVPTGGGRGSAAGVFVEQGAAALHGCESGITGQLYGVSTYIERRGTGAKRKTIWKKYRHYEQTAGPFDRVRAGSSTAPLAMRLRESPLRMTISTSINPLSSSYMSIYPSVLSLKF